MLFYQLLRESNYLVTSETDLLILFSCKFTVPSPKIIKLEIQTANRNKGGGKSSWSTS